MVTGRCVDVSDEAGVRQWVGDTAAELGGLDIVVANVSALAIPDEEANWRASFDVDMMGTVHLVNAALPHLERSEAASIVTISSVSGREVDFAAGPYATMKAAIIHYTQGLAYQLAAKSIRANSLSPGNTYFPGGVWENVRAEQSRAVRHGAGTEPHRADGAAGGDRPGRGIPGQPGRQLHHRRQPAGRRSRLKPRGVRLLSRESQPLPGRPLPY